VKAKRLVTISVVYVDVGTTLLCNVLAQHVWLYSLTIYYYIVLVYPLLTFAYVHSNKILYNRAI